MRTFKKKKNLSVTKVVICGRAYVSHCMLFTDAMIDIYTVFKGILLSCGYGFSQSVFPFVTLSLELMKLWAIVSFWVLNR